MRENTLTPDDIAAFLNEVFKDSSLLASMNECAYVWIRLMQYPHRQCH